jgi:hypothetical protein
MITRDFIMRMVEQLAVALARILFHKEAKQYDMAEQEIDAASRRLIGVPMSFLLALPEEQLLELLGGDAQPDKLLAAAEVLRLESELNLEQGEAGRSIEYCMKAIGLFNRVLDLLRNDRSMLSMAPYEKLLSKLNAFALPPAFVERRFVFHERTGSYAKAEDDLFELFAEDIASLNRGREFYHRLLALQDEELERGDLPRAEVVDGLNKLLKRET